METPEQSGRGGCKTFRSSKFPEPMEQSMNKDDVRVETVDSGRKNQVAANAVDPAIPAAANRIQKKPAKKLQHMRSRDGGNFVPEDASGSGRESASGIVDREILDAICVEMNFAVVCVRKTFQQFGKSTLRPMTAVHER